MCTVSFVPVEGERFIFTSNRDEAPKRNASELVQLERNGKQILFPKDTGANGTWIAISNENQLVCILNGAFKKHKRKLPYRLSRGIMALEFFDFQDHRAFLSEFDFVNIEPFTMIIFDDGTLLEFRWDGEKKYVKNLDTSDKHIWSSCTLYPDEWVAKRKVWFREWASKIEQPTREDVLDFHKNAGEGNPEYDTVMNRSDIVRTISITSITQNDSSMNMRYEDILAGDFLEGSLGIRVTS